MTLENGGNDSAAQLIESHIVRLMSGYTQSKLPFEVSESDMSDEEALVTDSVINEE